MATNGKTSTKQRISEPATGLTASEAIGHTDALPGICSPQDLGRLRGSATRASALLRAMSNSSRLLVLCRIVGQEQSVGDLADAIGLSSSALSQHLAILRREKIVTTRRQGQTIFYSIASREAQAVMQTLYEMFCVQPPVSTPTATKPARKPARRAPASRQPATTGAAR